MYLWKPRARATHSEAVVLAMTDAFVFTVFPTGNSTFRTFCSCQEFLLWRSTQKTEHKEPTEETEAVANK